VATYTEDEVLALLELEYERGFLVGYTRVAADAGRADLAWQLSKRLSVEDWYRRRIAQMQDYPGPWTLARRARGLPPDYPGRPWFLHWVTGELVDLAAALASCQ